MLDSELYNSWRVKGNCVWGCMNITGQTKKKKKMQWSSPCAVHCLIIKPSLTIRSLQFSRDDHMRASPHVSVRSSSEPSSSRSLLSWKVFIKNTTDKELKPQSAWEKLDRPTRATRSKPSEVMQQREGAVSGAVGGVYSTSACTCKICSEWKILI